MHTLLIIASPGILTLTAWEINELALKARASLANSTYPDITHVRVLGNGDSNTRSRAELAFNDLNMPNMNYAYYQNHMKQNAITTHWSTITVGHSVSTRVYYEKDSRAVLYRKHVAANNNTISDNPDWALGPTGLIDQNRHTVPLKRMLKTSKPSINEVMILDPRQYIMSPYTPALNIRSLVNITQELHTLVSHLPTRIISL